MKRHIISSILLLSFVLSGFAQDKEKPGEISRTVKHHRAFKVGSECSVDISNKYGNVHLIPWTKDSVVIDIALTARGNNTERVNKILNYVDFDFTHTRYYIVAQTYFKDYANSVWTDISNIAGTLFSGGNSIEINYRVYMPVKAHVKVDNKFGNIYTTNHEGSLNINLSNGDLKANRLRGDNRLSVSFGSGNIQYIAKGTLDLNYSEFFDIREAGDIIIHSKSSKVSLDKVTKLDLHSRRDKYTVAQAGTLTGNFSFSYLNVYGLENEMRLETKYGNLSIQGIDPGFSFLGVTAHFTDISTYLDQGLEFELELIYDKKTSLSLPVEFGKFNRELINKQDDIYQIKGRKGSNPQGRLRIECTSGGMTIIQK